MFEGCNGTFWWKGGFMTINISKLSNPIVKINEKSNVDGINDAARHLLEEWEFDGESAVPPLIAQKTQEALDHEERLDLKRQVGNGTYLLQLEPFPSRGIVVVQAIRIDDVEDDGGYFRALLQNCPDLFYQLDPDGYIRFINEGISEFGYGPDELIDQPFVTIVHPKDEDKVREELVLSGAADLSEPAGNTLTNSLEIRMDITNGSDRLFDVRSKRLDGGKEPAGDQPLTGTVGVIREVTDKRWIKEELEEKEERLRTMAENFDEVFWMFDGSFRELLYVNDQVESIYGISPEELREDGLTFFNGIYPDHHARVEEAIERLRNGEKVKLEYRVNKEEDFCRWVSVQGVPIFEEGSVERIIGSSREITERKKYEKELEQARKQLKQQTYEDPLLHIPNRRLFNERFQEEWSRALRESNPLSMLLVDIDEFKKYNDRYGHQQGDWCLKKIAETLENELKRKTDIVARYGGEEFVVILSNTDEEGLRTVAERLRTAVRECEIPHETSSVTDYVTISLGGATMVPDASTSRDALLRVVDEQLYEAKEQGKDQVSI
jgi:diguanylate cyclase (GGDEF)-like protein/PAS domain S-box-containing protein